MKLLGEVLMVAICLQLGIVFFRKSVLGKIVITLFKCITGILKIVLNVIQKWDNAITTYNKPVDQDATCADNVIPFRKVNSK